MDILSGDSLNALETDDIPLSENEARLLNIVSKNNAVDKKQLYNRLIILFILFIIFSSPPIKSLINKFIPQTADSQYFEIAVKATLFIATVCILTIFKFV